MHQNVMNPSENGTNSIAEKLGVFRTKVMKHQDLVRFRVTKPRARFPINLFYLSLSTQYSKKSPSKFKKNRAQNIMKWHNVNNTISTYDTHFQR